MRKHLSFHINPPSISGVESLRRDDFRQDQILSMNWRNLSRASYLARLADHGGHKVIHTAGHVLPEGYALANGLTHFLTANHYGRELKRVLDEAPSDKDYMVYNIIESAITWENESGGYADGASGPHWVAGFAQYRMYFDSFFKRVVVEVRWDRDVHGHYRYSHTMTLEVAILMTLIIYHSIDSVFELRITSRLTHDNSIPIAYSRDDLPGEGAAPTPTESE